MIQKKRCFILGIFFMICLCGGKENAAAELPKGEARIGSQFFQTVEEALNASSNGQIVFLEKDAEITENVSVKKGVTLVLPADTSDLTGYDSEQYNPANTGTVSAPYQYRKLTIAPNVVLDIKGTVLVNAVTGVRVSAASNGYDVSGGYSAIDLQGKIQVESGGFLDVFGYVTGSGSIHALSGGKVSDLFVVRNWRGGTYAAITTTVLNVYPMNEYDMHNIRSKMRIDSGASLVGAVRIFADGQYHNARFPQIDNDNGMIRLYPNGYVIKTYEHERERIDLYGGAEFDSSSLKLTEITLRTKDYSYPIDGDITIDMHEGSYQYKENFKHMPGAKVIVESNAALVIPQLKFLVFYGADFRDSYTKGGTAYPQGREAAQLLVHGKLNVQGNIAGEVIIQNKKSLTMSSDSKSEITVIESGSENGMKKVWKERLKLRFLEDFDDDELTIQGGIGIPKGLKASVTKGNKVRLSWKKAAEAESYVIYRAVSKNGSYIKIGKTSKLSYTDRNVKIGKTYYYKIHGSRTGKNGSFTKIISKKVIPLAPAKVKGNSSKAKNTLKWSKVKKASGYQIYRAASAKGKYKRIAETKKISYSDRSVKKRKEYNYKVRAYVLVGHRKIYGAYTKPVKITTK